MLDTPAKIYYKYEGVSPAGSHKPNTAVAQAFYNKEAGIRRIATETGAGQWGSSLAMACSVFGLECNIYMVKVSFHQKPYRKLLMQTYGATVHASPSNQTDFGRKVLAEEGVDRAAGKSVRRRDCGQSVAIFAHAQAGLARGRLLAKLRQREFGL